MKTRRLLWLPAVSDDDQIVACFVGSCTAPATLHSISTSSSSERRHRHVFLDEAGATLAVGWYDAGFVQALRVSAGPVLNALEPPYRAPSRDTAPYRCGPPFALLHASPNDLSVVWQDGRWGDEELYSQHFALPACGP